MRLALRTATTLGLLAAGVAATVASAGGIPTLQPKAGDPLPGLTPAQLQLFEAGKARYSTPLTIETGLGPIFNKAGCFSCHANPLGGWGSISVTRFGYENKDGTFNPLAELGGSLLQLSAISFTCLETVPPEANVVGTRQTNSSMAFGLVEAIPSKAIAANADEADLNGDGISGRVRWVEPFEAPGTLKVGRFGWKAQVATVLTFSADASLNEMGLTNRFITTENAPNGDASLLGVCDEVPDPEDHADAQGLEFIDHVTNFQRYLAAPPQTPKSGMAGEPIFNAIGCAKCHIAQWTTSTDRNLEPAIRGKTIRPYSDFLLHEMSSLADGIADDFASGAEFRTPTLWNLRTRDPMLHNGMASGGTFESRVTDAINAHGPFGEGAASAAAFAALSSADQTKLIAFLDSLGRMEFDMDGDNQINYSDVILLRDCYGTKGVTPDSPCAVADIDQNGVINMTDALAFDVAYPGPTTDCNGNGIPDIVDIVIGTSNDVDYDGIPDECQGCIGDLNGSGAVDAADLGILLGAWGNLAFDLDGDGVVGATDLGILLGAWGACP
ncbi:MAG: di-heme oxidoredictase family protein [Phycisphaerales bacterium]